ncbi:MAG: hypothetical protein AAFN77_05615 [Planctomycetota bacterium]
MNEAAIGPGSAKTWWCWFAIIATISLVIRYAISLHDSLWLDELHTGWVVGNQLSDVWPRAAIGNQSPLYFWLTWFAFQVLPNETGIRFISMLASIGTIGLTGWIVFRSTASLCGSTLTMSLICFADPFLYYGTEGRPYALVQLLSVVQLLSFWQFLRVVSQQNNDDRPARMANAWRASLMFVASSAALVYTHLTGGLIAIPELIFGMIWIVLSNRNDDRGFSRVRSLWSNRWLVIGSVATLVVICWPLLDSLATVSQRRSNWNSVAFASRLFLDVWPMVLVWFMLPMIVWVSAVKWNRTETRLKQYLRCTDSFVLPFWLVWVWGIGVLASLFLLQISLIAPLAMLRYFSVGIVAGPVLCGMLFQPFNHARIRSRLIPVCLFGLLLLLNLKIMSHQESWLTTSVNQQRLLRLRSENWFEAISEINRSKHRSAYPLFLYAAVIEDHEALSNRESSFQEYLQFPVRSLYSLDADRRVVVGPTLGQPHFDSEDINAAKRNGGAWLLIRHQDEIANEILREFLEIAQQPTASVNYLANDDSVVILVVIDFN